MAPDSFCEQLVARGDAHKTKGIDQETPAYKFPDTVFVPHKQGSQFDSLKIELWDLEIRKCLQSREHCTRGRDA